MPFFCSLLTGQAKLTEIVALQLPKISPTSGTEKGVTTKEVLSLNGSLDPEALQSGPASSFCFCLANFGKIA